MNLGYNVIVYSTGATVISKLLVDNYMIQELWMSGNTIGDDGIAAIAIALTNSRISQLWVDGCSITLTGARSIATLLSANHSTSIKELVLYNNSITTEGARLILQSAVNNKTCQVNIYIDDEYWGDSEVQTLMDALEVRRRTKTDVVGHLCGVYLSNCHCNFNRMKEIFCNCITYWIM